ncbi:hypothetical protein NMY22_g4261 [Coprinellus aureogranulatus]|nr:hypothetical protein NMY22_g4261 [Coprinellus aureogranulatus]
MAAQWTKPSTRPDPIEDLVSGVDRYNPSNVGILEDYLYHQIRSEEYDLLANLAILKLYQFNPDLYNPDVVINILLKALAASPLPDFNLCTSLFWTNGRRQARWTSPIPFHTPFPSSKPLQSLLYRCRFPAFWQTYHSEEFETLRDNYTVEVAGFENSIRQVAIRAVTATFTHVSSQRLGSYLNLQGADLANYVKQLGWTVDPATGNITVPPNPDNQIEATVVQEQIKLPPLSDAELTKVISHAVKA